jgi:hypothetical protein
MTPAALAAILFAVAVATPPLAAANLSYDSTVQYVLTATELYDAIVLRGVQHVVVQRHLDLTDLEGPELHSRVYINGSVPVVPMILHSATQTIRVRCHVVLKWRGVCVVHAWCSWRRLPERIAPCRSPGAAFTETHVTTLQTGVTLEHTPSLVEFFLNDGGCGMRLLLWCQPLDHTMTKSNDPRQAVSSMASQVVHDPQGDCAVPIVQTIQFEQAAWNNTSVCTLTVPYQWLAIRNTNVWLHKLHIRPPATLGHESDHLGSLGWSQLDIQDASVWLTDSALEGSKPLAGPDDATGVALSRGRLFSSGLLLLIQAMIDVRQPVHAAYRIVQQQHATRHPHKYDACFDIRSGCCVFRGTRAIAALGTRHAWAVASALYT